MTMTPREYMERQIRKHNIDMEHARTRGDTKAYERLAELFSTAVRIMKMIDEKED